ncbi:hypothetical protein PVAND_004671 [Polypedilum vanderplanki]|uniref:Exonuclease domain-containing protein n=1 Tax=Polypedilum vanderplanki TaxID=319348 RepID=A0A9J6BXW8_POLVA|nr:hypothetical protein PVAND_004671 [Polypedilum vanderplanki]
MAAATKGRQIVWMDMEMTGLEYKRDRVLQIAMLITDLNLNIISREFLVTIHQDKEVLDKMNDWCKENLKEIAEESLKSKITEADAEKMMIDFFNDNKILPKNNPLAGNTIYMDRLFLREYFPKVNDHLHYRLIDVSTIKELCSRWNKPVYQRAPEKKNAHHALSDIKNSIEELKYYKEGFLKIATDEENKE